MQDIVCHIPITCIFKQSRITTIAINIHDPGRCRHSLVDNCIHTMTLHEIGIEYHTILQRLHGNMQVSSRIINLKCLSEMSTCKILAPFLIVKRLLMYQIAIRMMNCLPRVHGLTLRHVLVRFKWSSKFFVVPLVIPYAFRQVRFIFFLLFLLLLLFVMRTAVVIIMSHVHVYVHVKWTKNIISSFLLTGCRCPYFPDKTTAIAMVIHSCSYMSIIYYIPLDYLNWMYFVKMRIVISLHILWCDTCRMHQRSISWYW
mmetsp:Transcript_6090/g.11559  ORF Transcript_6090/g.11559 Transcript_6090/m.11559 type:complete len:257 (+) Transcript_6090:774-1544(+)